MGEKKDDIRIPMKRKQSKVVYYDITITLCHLFCG